MRKLALWLPLLLAACGSAKGLVPPPGGSLPVAPYGARSQPTATQLVTPTPQQRPQRGDELLQSSEARQGNDFDLPPED